MRINNKVLFSLVFSVLVFFAGFSLVDSDVWAKAGGGGSAGSRGSRSFSAPSMPARPSPGSPGITSAGQRPNPGLSGQPSSGVFGRSPFLQGIAGGLAGGLLGSMLFGGTSHASAGGMTGGGIGLLEIVLLGVVAYFAWKLYKRRRVQAVALGPIGSSGYFEPGMDEPRPYRTSSQTESFEPPHEVERSFQQMKQSDPGFNQNDLMKVFQDMFFRIQAGWVNRSLAGIENMLTKEMCLFFEKEFETMRQKGRINRLENIAVHKVEPSEAWQETRLDYVTVLFTADLLDYTVDDVTGQVVAGDKLNPIGFQELWTFSREIGSSEWKLSAINQVEDGSARVN